MRFNISSLFVLCCVDEGTDTGFIYVDNLLVNGQYITKPGTAK